MDDRTQPSAGPRQPGPPAREFEVVVLGATGLTGRLVVEQLGELVATEAGGIVRWAVAGRSEQRLRALAADLGTDPGIVVTDTTDLAALRALAARTGVLLNLAGPYTDTAPDVIEACVGAATSYVDLSGELPLLQRVNRRFDRPAREAGVAVVQMAGWEALPADLASLAACRAVTATTPADGADGPGLAAPVHEVEVTVRFDRLPEGGVARGQSVSGGTLASIVAMLADPDSRIIGDPAGLLPARSTRSAVGPPRLRPRRRDGRVIGPVVPVAFLDPPVVHRTAALLAAERGEEHRPATYLEGVDQGPATGPGSRTAWVQATGAALLQRAVVGAAGLPRPARIVLCSLLRRVIPSAGAGPSGRYLRDWEWTVTARATTATGRHARSTLRGTGHPGYTATATLLIAVARQLAATAPRRTGCVTPALVLGPDPDLDDLPLRLTTTTD